MSVDVSISSHLFYFNTNLSIIHISSAIIFPTGIGFGGLWRFAGPFTKVVASSPPFPPITPPSFPSQTTQNQDNAELFVNCLEAMVETCLPGDDLDVQNPYPSSLGITSNLNLSSSMSSLSMGSMHSPTDKDSTDLSSMAAVCGNGSRMRHGSASHMQNKCRVGSFKRKNSKKTPDGLE